jgi:hypothetical protein
MYDGGAPVISYTVAMSALGAKTVTQTLKATLDKKGKVVKAPPTLLNVTKLANGTRYTVKITATNAKGVSDNYITTVPVA